MFRKQVLESQFDKVLGDVNLTQPLKFKILISFISFIVLTTIVFLFTSDYHSKKTVLGRLSPSVGVVKTYAPGMVYVEEVFVEEGQVVQKDQPLLKLKYRKTLTSGEDTNRSLQEQLKYELHLLNDQADNLRKVSSLKIIESKHKIDELNEQSRLYDLQKQQIELRIQFATSHINKYKSMLESGFISQLKIDEETDKLLTLQQSHARLKAQIATSLQQKLTLTTTLRRLPVELNKALLENRLQASAKQKRLTELSANSEILITASKAGHITAIDVQHGQLLKPQQYMLSIMPNNMKLYAELFIPTRAFGFVELGQETRIKMDSFPYQKFGIIQGKIFEITEFVLLADEVKLPSSIKEPVYKVKAQINRQTITAYGKNINLQAGMNFTADIFVDKRSLIEWLFEPLLTLTQ